MDVAGNVYVTGDFDNTADFGPYDLSSSGIFVTKLDTDGNWLWAERATANQSVGIGLDSNSNIYLTGSIDWSAYFGDIHLVSTGNDDIFVAKMSSIGAWLWAINGGGEEDDYCHDIAVDTGGTSYITGYFKYAAGFGTHSLTSYGHRDVFVATISSIGTWTMATNAGGTSWDAGQGICFDNSGNIYCTGFFYGEATFGTTNITGYGSNDIFISKLDAGGNWLWTNYAGGAWTDRGWDIELDSNLNPLITGEFSYNAAFGTINVTSAGTSDVYIARLDTSGNWDWVHTAGSSSSDYSYGIDIDTSDDAYITGKFQNTITFQDTMSSYGSSDVFVAKLTASGSAPPAAPAGVTVNIVDTNLTIAWNAVTGATLYNVYSDTDPYGTFSTLEWSGVNTSWNEVVTFEKKFYLVTAEN